MGLPWTLGHMCATSFSMVLHLKYVNFVGSLNLADRTPLVFINCVLCLVKEDLTSKNVTMYF